MEISPIGIFHSPLKTKFGLPRQSGVVSGLLGFVELQGPFAVADAVRGIEGFDYLWLIWSFSENEQTRKHPTVRPPRLGGNERMGVFATRSSFRPNNLALSCVKLERVETTGGVRLFVSGADLMDGTPVFDIKPYLPSCDAHQEARGGFTDQVAWQPLEVEAAEGVKEKAGSDWPVIASLVAQDPRPHYHDDPEREYGMQFGQYDVKFRVNKSKALITNVLTLKNKST